MKTMQKRNRKILYWCGPALLLTSVFQAHSFELRLPIACEVGDSSCFVQNYVDHDPSPSARDYTCGSETQDGHDGTDFRLPSMVEQRIGVAVLAAAEGQVLRTRDGMPDVSVRAIGAEQVRGRECGNGVIIAHADGFMSEYCHLAQGSLRVRPGDVVKAGQPLGKVGLSGNTEFAHLHFTLRENGNVIDPFAYGAPSGGCGGGRSLWSPSAVASLGYRSIAILNMGFGGHPVTAQDIENGSVGPWPKEDSESLVAYVRVISLRRGDVQLLSVTGPKDKPFASYAVGPLDRDMAQYTLMAGRKRPNGAWERGVYRATYQVKRHGELLIERTFELQL
jgi:hypothetical protein